MFIQLRTIVVEPGNAEQVAGWFVQAGHIDTMPGLIDRTVLVSRKNKESEEVIAMIRWESEDAWKNWEKDPVHLAGHREKRNEESPSYIISSSVKMYDATKVDTSQLNLA
ncbi:antibiotic biosynthesis monooxygenase [Paenibacillus sp. GSMTC-2017]|uniref:antibiotic biosynthesis monooxygenase family protein n=1 Tax=Paenibacillus sp. GSMTC-2017 TaxID=2794350 RepID=UPI0018D701FF|nr:antibiotic biosynthesis monooxygenase [Paenibacillus sp. GSMTC-2017]MBH5317875.1 antibiotic biosynthesis monooxygenase [Paenibacillus sp. GSMTC-2017]